MADTSPTDGTGRSTKALLREVLLTGVAVVVPAAVTGYVLWVLFSSLAGLLRPVAQVFPVPTVVGQLLAAVALLGLLLAVGFVAHFRTGKRAIHYFDAAVGRVPGLGAVYRSFRRMSDVMLEDDTDQFQEVKLIGFPSHHTSMLAFVTASTPDRLATAVGAEDLTTLYVPLAPNPVMGGFVVHVPDEHVHDVDLTVEEAFRAIVTSGVALGDTAVAGGALGGAEWELRDPARAAVADLDDLRELRLADLREAAGTASGDLTLGEVRELELADLEARLLGEADDRRDAPPDETADGSEAPTESASPGDAGP